jgi:hypothetical protein
MKPEKITLAAAFIAAFLLLGVILACPARGEEPFRGPVPVVIHLDHPLNAALSVQVRFDGKTVFSGLVGPVKRMPPIAWSGVVQVGEGPHEITFVDLTRKIVEKRRFLGGEAGSILIKTKKDVLEKRHIVICRDRVPIK